MNLKRLREDIASLTTLPVSTLGKLEDIATQDIAHIFYESILDEDPCVVDIGIGRLNIENVDDQLIYKYTPSNTLQEYLSDVLKNKKDVLFNNVDKSLSTKIIKTYKELF